MKNEIKIINGLVESRESNIEISLKSNGLNNVELLLRGIEVLIESIDLDQDPNYDTMKFYITLQTELVLMDGIASHQKLI